MVSNFTNDAHIRRPTRNPTRSRMIFVQKRFSQLSRYLQNVHRKSQRIVIPLPPPPPHRLVKKMLPNYVRKHHPCYGWGDPKHQNNVGHTKVKVQRGRHVQRRRNKGITIDLQFCPLVVSKIRPQESPNVPKHQIKSTVHCPLVRIILP